MVDLARHHFHPVIRLPPDYTVFDFTRPDPALLLRTRYGVGRYDEKRAGLYNTAIFGGVRDIHMGIDLMAPPGEPVHAFADGELYCFGENTAPGDYGPVVITRHELDGVPLWALHGHLSRDSLPGKREGAPVRAGEVIGRVGTALENGGWPPHVHFQLSWERPATHDLPGVVAEADRERALGTYPDPQLVLGKLY